MIWLAVVLAASPLELSISGCREAEVSELRRIVASELANGRPRSPIRASVECCPTSAEVTLELSQHEYSGRLVELGDVEPALRARTIALALVELAAAYEGETEAVPLRMPPAAVHAQTLQLDDERPPRRLGWRGLTGYVFIGVSTAALVAAGIFGWHAKVIRDEVDNATLNSEGSVIGLTQATAFGLERELATTTLVAEVLLGAAALTLAAGLAFVLFDARDTEVALAPFIGGAALCAVF
jgi:hypothetical protein